MNTIEYYLFRFGLHRGVDVWRLRKWEENNSVNWELWESPGNSQELEAWVSVTDWVDWLEFGDCVIWVFTEDWVAWVDWEGCGVVGSD